jgi:hypothetical protein
MKKCEPIPNWGDAAQLSWSGRPAHSWERALVVFFQLTTISPRTQHVRYGSLLPSPLPPILATVSSWLQHRNFSEFNGGIIQGDYFLLSCLYLPNRSGAPNAIRGHSLPDLPPQTLEDEKRRALCAPCSPPPIFFTNILQWRHVCLLPSTSCSDLAEFVRSICLVGELLDWFI